MLFKILAEKNADDKAVFFYDNMTNTLSDETGFVIEYPNIQEPSLRKASQPFSKDEPLSKSKNVQILKIQLGLSCNYSCSYCSQRFVDRADETSMKHVESFMKKLEHLEFDEKKGLKIELWGGEPLVYWKTIQPLVAALKEKFFDWLKKPQFSMITNGSLLTYEISDWLMLNDFSIAISHDGPGQHVRGPDPLDDPKKREVILKLYHRLKPYGRISFNSMLNGSNVSRKEVFDWFVNLTGDKNVSLGEGGLIDAYDVDGLSNMLTTKEDHFKFRRQAFNDIFSTQGDIGFFGVLQKIDSFTKSVLGHTHADFVGQKCGMDDEHILAVDLRGDVVTCQNVSSVSEAMNGMSHKAGNITDMDSVKIRTGTHWKNRPDCAGCPVLHLCQGACLFLEGEYWQKSCANAYSDAMALFALSIEKMTGYIPYFIEADHLPDERKDMWGTVLNHPETVAKDVSAKVLQEITIVEGVEVFTKARAS